MNPSQADANRRNAVLSSGPKTPEGKRRASLNALRHGLTGQTVVLPSDDLAAYQKHCAQFHTELKPQGLLETKIVQTITDTYWRLDRIRAMENNLFALAVEEREPLSSDPLISSALAQAQMLKDGADLLARLSLYEQRLNRTLVQAQAQLKQLQHERTETETRALETAAKIRNLKEALAHSERRRVALDHESSNSAIPLELCAESSKDEDWLPEENGFEFSSTQLDTWMDRRQLLEEADDFRCFGRLPDASGQPDFEEAAN